MALLTPVTNVFVSSTPGDTIAGPISIRSIKLLAGSAAGTGTLTVNGTVIWSSGTVAIGTSIPADNVDTYIPQGVTATITLSGTGAVMYIYERRR